MNFVPSGKDVSHKDLQTYVSLLADLHGISYRIVLDTKVDSIRLNEDSSEQTWTVTTHSPEMPTKYTNAKFVILAGPMAKPQLPDLKGMGSFRGLSFHTARWNATSLKNKRVGIVGTGTAASRVITAIADDVKHLFVFQRTPVYCRPSGDESNPKARVLNDNFLSDTQKDAKLFEDINDPHINEQMASEIRKRIQETVKDPAVASALCPDYPLFYKRVVVVDNYYETFNKQNVTLVADSGGVTRMTPGGLETSHSEHFDLDIIIFATGFSTDFLGVDITGRDGKSIYPNSKTLYGMHRRGFLNMFQMLGSTSTNPITNTMYLAQEQADYIAALLLKMQREGSLSCDARENAVNKWFSDCNDSSLTLFNSRDRSNGDESVGSSWWGTLQGYSDQLHQSLRMPAVFDFRYF